MDYIKKLEELLSKGYTHQEIAENLYLNYQSVIDTDEVYKIRKKISQKYLCNINDVKLIGSAHTGYTHTNGKILKRENPEDYDFAIISAEVFVRIFHKVNLKNLRNNELYQRNVLRGKIHPFYADNKLCTEINNNNKDISEELKITRHISVCFYLSEKAFIDGLVQYNNELYTAKLKQLKDNSISKIPDMPIKDIDKMGE